MSQISNQVMKKVKRIYWMRKFTTRQAGEVYLLALSCAGLSTIVSIPNVFANMPKADLFTMSGYITYAVTHTHLAVQIILFVAAISFVAIVADFVQTIARLQKYSVAR